jgi:hypothetical protein
MHRVNEKCTHFSQNICGIKQLVYLCVYAKKERKEGKAIPLTGRGGP